VADFTYVATFAGIVYVAFVVDIYSRAIVGWSASTSKRAKLVLDALDMALWRRERAGHKPGKGLIHHSDAGSQYTSFAFTAHLIEAGLDASIGTVGDALDNALMESTIGLYKTELIKKRGPWKKLSGVELATAEYLDWFNARRLPHRHRGHPAQRVRSRVLRSPPTPVRRLESTTELSIEPGGFIYAHPADAGRCGRRALYLMAPGWDYQGRVPSASK
jgi:transposase InsO family protein